MVSGASVIERQIDVALALGCTRIFLFTPELDALAIKAQRLAEQGGAQFRLVQRGRQLLGSLRQQDELLVLAEGLLPANRECLDFIGEKGGILRIDAEEGVPAGFERLDADYCWAGAMVLPGRVLERLEELGEDMDPVSALLRAGRVSRVPETTLPDGWLANGSWSLAPNRASAFAGDDADPESSDIVVSLLSGSPGEWLAVRPKLAVATGAGAILASILSLATIYLGLPAVGMALLAFAGLLAKGWIVARRQSAVLLFSGNTQRSFVQPIVYTIDLVGIVALAHGMHASFNWYSSGYIAFLTWAVWAIAANMKGKAAFYYRDRTPLWLGCAIAGFASQWFVGATLLTVIALLGIVLNLRNQPAITQA